LDMEAVAGAEGDGGEGDHGVAGDEAEAELLGDGGEDERGFHEGEGIADALARSEAEREVGEAGDFLEEIAFPTFRVENFGGIVPAGIPMDDPRDSGDAGTFGDGVAGELMVFDGQARDGPSWRIETHGFGEDVAGVGELREIIESGSAAIEDGVEFGMKFFFDAGMLREEPPGPGEGAGGGLVAGKEESESFIAELLCGHAGAVFILCLEKHGEEVAGVLRGLAALLDDAVDDLRELTNGAVGLEVAARREPLGSHDETAKVGGVFEEDGEGFANLRGVAFDIGVEESFADHLKGEAHHGVVEVERLTGLPGFEEARGACGHGRGVIGNAGAVKGGLHHAALTEPEIALAGEEAIAENVAVGTEDAALDEFARVIDKDVFDMIGVEEKERANVKEAEADDVTVIARGTRHEGERVAAERAAQAVKETWFGPGRIEGHGEMVRGKGGKRNSKFEKRGAGKSKERFEVEILRP